MPASKRIGRHSTDGGCESTDDHDRNDWQHHDNEDAEDDAEAGGTGNRAGTGGRGQDLEIADCDLKSGDTTMRSCWVRLLASNWELAVRPVPWEFACANSGRRMASDHAERSQAVPRAVPRSSPLRTRGRVRGRPAQSHLLPHHSSPVVRCSSLLSLLPKPQPQR